MDDTTLLVTGGAGFIGSALIRELIANSNYTVVNIDKLTYAGNLESLASVCGNPRYIFEHVDITDKGNMQRIFKTHTPAGIIHLAAESHVDRSISGPGAFIQTNIVGTYTMLECAREYYAQLSAAKRDGFKFMHISTDEVFGSLSGGGYFNEATPYDPRSPYSASKAASDLLVKAWQHTYQLPVIITNCTNNYGPYHFPEKLIPLMINNAVQGKDLPLYGTGENIRDWLYVEDHVRAIILAYEQGTVGESYCIGSHNERSNLQVVTTICEVLDQLKPRGDRQSYKLQIKYVSDRPGHDYRYAMDPTKIQAELGWVPQENFASGIKKTVQWYLDNQEWVRHVVSGEYQNWLRQNYTER